MLHILEITGTLKIKIFILFVINLLFLVIYLLIISSMSHVSERFILKLLLYTKKFKEKLAGTGRVWCCKATVQKQKYLQLHL
jgi:hypothetical protein